MNNTALTNTLAILIALLAGIPLGVCIILGADRGNFELIAIGSLPLAAALSSLVTHYFDGKTINNLQSQVKGLQAKIKGV